MGLGTFSSRMGRKIYKGTGDIKDLAGEGLNMVTGTTAARAARDAAKVQAGATDTALAAGKDALASNQALNKPWLDAGMGSLSDLVSGMKSGAFDYTADQPPPEYQDPGFNFQTDPGYQFRQQQQQQAIERSAAAGGGFFSGATLSDLVDRSGKMASQEFGAANDRYQQNRNFGYNAAQDRLQQYNLNQANKRQSLASRFDMLSKLAGISQAATNTAMGNNNAFSGLVGDTAIQKANALASGKVGAANAQQEGIMGLANLGASIYGSRSGGK